MGAELGRGAETGPGADLSVRVLGRAFGGQGVLGALAFRAASGEVLALLAPSGAGKTTLLHIVLGLDRGFEGDVIRPTGPVAAVFQEPRLLPWLTVAENLRLVRPDLPDAAVLVALDEVELREVAGLRPGQISLGMARRVALARALAVRPALLVLDEAFASLDTGLAGRLAALVAARARAIGAIVLMATHDLEQAVTMADRVLVLQGRPARLVRDGPPDAAGLLAQFEFLGGEDARQAARSFEP